MLFLPDVTCPARLNVRPYVKEAPQISSNGTEGFPGLPSINDLLKTVAQPLGLRKYKEIFRWLESFLNKAYTSRWVAPSCQSCLASLFLARNAAWFCAAHCVSWEHTPRGLGRRNSAVWKSYSLRSSCQVNAPREILKNYSKNSNDNSNRKAPGIHIALSGFECSHAYVIPLYPHISIWYMGK